MPMAFMLSDMMRQMSPKAEPLQLVMCRDSLARSRDDAMGSSLCG